MAVWYLDNDAEITDAVARLRGADDEHVVFVVPPGSRIATGRINFKLLAREAESRGLALAVASPDQQVRALATSAGVLTAATPDAAEAALRRGDVPPPVATDPVPDVSEPAETTSGSGDRGLRWRSQRLRVTTVVLLIALIIGGFVALQTLPTAVISLTPRLIAIGPIAMQVTASLETTQADVARGTIPAVSISIPLSVEDTYPSSGTQALDARAKGEVVFSALGQEFDQEIAAGTRVQTPAGTAFQTTETVTLPRGDDGSMTRVTATVEALTGGEVGNVPANAIGVVPSLESQGISVSNPSPTEGGRFEETPLVLAADFDAAAVDLANRLAGELAVYLRDPANTSPGLTVFPETAVLGPVVRQPPATEVVGTNAAEFTLGGAVTATVLAVDEAGIDELTRDRLLQTVPQDVDLIPGSASVGHQEGRVEGERIIFESTAAGQGLPRIDADALLAEVAGLPVSDAQAILEALGTATVTVWPGFLGDLPNDRERITLDVTEASATE